MNYIELINRFWQEVEMKDFLPSEACVYFRLLDICNKLGWQNPFSLSNSRAVALMAMNEKTFRAIRDKLGGRGLIEFKKGKKRRAHRCIVSRKRLKMDGFFLGEFFGGKKYR